MREGVQVKYLIDQILVESDGLENLRAAVALYRRDAHLRDHLDDAFVYGLDVVRYRLFMIDARQQPRGDHVVARSRRPDKD